MTCVDELMSMKLDKIKSNYDEFGGMYKQILIALQEKEKREIRYNSVCVFVRACFYLIIFFYSIYILTDFWYDGFFAGVDECLRVVPS